MKRKNKTNIFDLWDANLGEGNGNPLQCSCLENPRDGKPGGLPSMGSYRVGHDRSNLAAAAADASLHIIGIPEGEERDKGIEKSFEKIIAENLLNRKGENI